MSRDQTILHLFAQFELGSSNKLFEDIQWPLLANSALSGSIDMQVCKLQFPTGQFVEFSCFTAPQLGSSDSNIITWITFSAQCTMCIELGGWVA